MTEHDYFLALNLQREFNQENASPVPAKRRKVHTPGPSSLVSPTWEFLDPNPDIYSLFQEFNSTYFWGKLGAVEVKWSPRMYSCAGICTYKGRAGCVVSLSQPLLKLRPRKDLVETLLHEMIHAYLFVTHNNIDRDGHGPEFHKHMDRINLVAGTHITVYHSFHDEVAVYRTHWWKCDGPCQTRPPYFGIVKRPMNRAPGPHDRWYAYHRATCGGNFVKIKEPDNYKAKKKTGKRPEMKDISTFFTSNNVDNRSCSKPLPSENSDAGSPLKSVTSTNQSNTVAKVFPKTNIHGFSNGSLAKPIGSVAVETGSLKSNRGGTFVVNPTKTATWIKSPTNSPQPFAGTGHVLGSSSCVTPFSGQGHVLGSRSTPPTTPINSSRVPSATIIDLTKVDEFSTASSSDAADCPICGDRFPIARMNVHLDDCLKSSDISADDFSEDIEFSDGACALPQPVYSTNCPYCDKFLPENQLQSHLDDCLDKSGLSWKDFVDDFEF